MLMRLIRRLIRRGTEAEQAAAVAPATQVSASAPALDPGAPARTASDVLTATTAADVPVVAPRVATVDVVPPPPRCEQHATSPTVPPVVATQPVATHLQQRLADACASVTAALPPGPAGDDLRQLLAALGGEPAQVIRQLPSAAQDALALCNGDDVTPAELLTHVEKDPMLTQALLQTANSSWYHRGGQPPVVSIRAAIERIGLTGLRTVLLKVTVSGLLCRPGGAFGPMVMQVWEHMVRTGPLARRLARAYAINPDTAFSLGLLHDVGKLVVFDQVANLRSTLRREVHADPEQIRLLLRQLHEPLGGTAALQWGLGDDAALAIASHHRSPAPQPESAGSEILFLAERADLADIRDLPFDVEAIWREGAITASKTRVVALLTEEQASATAAVA